MDITTSGISFGKEDLCKDVGSQIGDLQRGLDRTLSSGRGFASRGILDGISAINDDVDFSPTLGTDSLLGDLGSSMSDKLSGITSLKDKVISGEIVEGTNISVETIVDCLTGIDLGDLGKFGASDGTIPVDNIGKVLEGATDYLKDNMGDVLDQLFSPLEKTLSKAIDGLRNLLDIPALDKLFGLTDCLQDCPGADFGGVSTNSKQWTVYCIDEQKEFTVYSEDRPGTYACPTDSNHVCDEELTTLVNNSVLSPVLIEDKLSSIGLTTNGEIDWDSSLFTDTLVPESVKENMNKITDFKKGFEDNLSIAKKFTTLPEIPSLPALPEMKNILPNITPPTIPNIKVPELPLPTMPEVPDFKLALPSLPSLSGFGVSALPSLPSITMPTLPDLPALPEIPDLPSLPSLPGIPALPTLPNVDPIDLANQEVEDMISSLF